MLYCLAAATAIGTLGGGLPNLMKCVMSPEHSCMCDQCVAAAEMINYTSQQHWTPIGMGTQEADSVWCILHQLPCAALHSKVPLALRAEPEDKTLSNITVAHFLIGAVRLCPPACTMKAGQADNWAKGHSAVFKHQRMEHCTQNATA